jgi:death-on-curing protein
MANKITLNDVLQIHNKILFESEPFGIINKNGIISAVNAIYQTFEGGDLIPDIIDKAATLCFYLATAQHFSGGNKRTASQSMLFLLSINDIKFNISNDELVDITLSVAENKITKEQLYDWLKSKIIRNPHIPAANPS